jgi:hypothetical protein
MPNQKALSFDDALAQVNGSTPSSGAMSFEDALSKASEPSSDSSDASKHWQAVVASAKAAIAATKAVAGSNAAQIGSKVGRMVGAVAPTLGEFAAGNVPAGLAMAGQAGRTAWAGGKAGWFTGKLLKDAAGVVSKGLDAVPLASAGNWTSALGAMQNIPPQTESLTAEVQRLMASGMSLTQAVKQVHDRLLKGAQ